MKRTVQWTAALALSAGSALAQISIQQVPNPPGPYIRSLIYGISADGSAIFGEADGPQNIPSAPFVWTASGGSESLGSLGGAGGAANASTPDGSVIVGYSRDAAGASHAFRWTRAGGMQPLGDLPGLAWSDAVAVSSDGAAVCGSAFAAGGLPRAAFRWTQATGMQDIGDNADGIAISDDGLTVACSRSAHGDYGFLWHPSGIQAIPAVLATDHGQPVWLSRDGLSVLMWVSDYFEDGFYGMRWSAAGGFQGFYGGRVFYATPDASLVQFSDVDYNTHIVTGAHDYILSDYFRLRGLNTSGWNFINLTAASSDLRILVGNGQAPDGQYHGWIARAPSVCYANCDDSTTAPILNINDFQCFLNKFAAADPYANCDGSTVPPTLNINDFQCFLNAFATGCS